MIYVSTYCIENIIQNLFYITDNREVKMELLKWCKYTKESNQILWSTLWVWFSFHFQESLKLKRFWNKEFTFYFSNWVTSILNFIIVCQLISSDYSKCEHIIFYLTFIYFQVWRQIKDVRKRWSAIVSQAVLLIVFVVV